MSAIKEQLYKRWNAYSRANHLSQDSFHIFETAYALGVADATLDAVDKRFTSSGLANAVANEVLKNKLKKND